MAITGEASGVHERGGCARAQLVDHSVDLGNVEVDKHGIHSDRRDLRVNGRVCAPFVLTLEDLRSRLAVSMAVMMECAGSERARVGQQLSDFGQGACLRGRRVGDRHDG
jgi:DMSO/TMAO reductase YedYZ molybdopterin-dependent catalytic subunit